MFVVTENVKIKLDGKNYLLEKGDKIIINEDAVKTTSLINYLQPLFGQDVHITPMTVRLINIRAFDHNAYNISITCNNHEFSLSLSYVKDHIFVTIVDDYDEVIIKRKPISSLDDIVPIIKKHSALIDTTWSEQKSVMIVYDHDSSFKQIGVVMPGIKHVRSIKKPDHGSIIYDDDTMKFAQLFNADKMGLDIIYSEPFTFKFNPRGPYKSSIAVSKGMEITFITNDKDVEMWNSK